MYRIDPSKPIGGILKIPANANVCWYPSAGCCFRDLLLFRKLAMENDTPEPDYYLHTDYFNKIYFKPGLIFAEQKKEKFTKVKILHVSEIPLHLPIQYDVSPRCVDFWEISNQFPRLLLLDMEIESHLLGTFCKPVYYFCNRSRNFVKLVQLS